MKRISLRHISALLPHGFGLLCAVLFPLFVLCGCIHEYPQEAGGTSVQVNLTLEAEIDFELPLYGNFSRSTRTATDNLRRRFIVDVYRNGKVMEEKRIVTTRAELTDDGSYIIPVSLQLAAEVYTLVVWSDYVATPAGEDLHFSTGQLTGVALNDAYHPDHLQRETFCASQTADLTAYAGAPGAEIRLRIPLKRPQARFKIVSTDAGEFLSAVQTRKGGKASGSLDDYRVRVSYEYFFPTAYNVMDDALCGSSAGIGFTVPCSIAADGKGECELAGDFVFAGTEDSYVSLALEVLDDRDAVISRVTGVQVPCRQGCLTVVSGKFLTTLMRPGIGIDTDYEGEFNITI